MVSNFSLLASGEKISISPLLSALPLFALGILPLRLAMVGRVALVVCDSRIVNLPFLTLGFYDLRCKKDNNEKLFLLMTVSLLCRNVFS